MKERENEKAKKYEKNGNLIYSHVNLSMSATLVRNVDEFVWLLKQRNQLTTYSSIQERLATFRNCLRCIRVRQKCTPE